MKRILYQIIQFASFCIILPLMALAVIPVSAIKLVSDTSDKLLKALNRKDTTDEEKV